MNLWKSSAALAATLLMAACSEAPKQAPAEKKSEAKSEAPAPSGPVAAQTAFYEMYKPARTWAPDLLPLSLSSAEVPGIKNEEGKAAMWTAIFVSPAKREARTFTYSAADSGSTIHVGVSAGASQDWSGATPKSKPFQVSEFSVNSDAAYKTALGKAGAWVKKHPEKKVQMVLGYNPRLSAPVWYVLWGNQKLGYGVFVNATTGLVMK